ncbi:hypothetical protein CVT24_001609, partial [Panaeolus cyanescens]
MATKPPHGSSPLNPHHTHLIHDHQLDDDGNVQIECHGISYPPALLSSLPVIAHARVRPPSSVDATVTSTVNAATATATASTTVTANVDTTANTTHDPPHAAHDQGTTTCNAQTTSDPAQGDNDLSSSPSPPSDSEKDMRSTRELGSSPKSASLSSSPGRNSSSSSPHSSSSSSPKPSSSPNPPTSSSNPPTSPSPLKPIRTLTASQFCALQMDHTLAHPRDSVLFPFLHGLEGDNHAQNTFFASSSGGRVVGSAQGEEGYGGGHGQEGRYGHGHGH